MKYVNNIQQPWAPVGVEQISRLGGENNEIKDKERTRQGVNS